MTVTLDQKLASIPYDEMVNELSSMLANSLITISWWGARLVSIGGYEETVYIDTLARKYLHAKPFDYKGSSCSLKERLVCYNLWEDIENLYKKSDEELIHTSTFTYLLTYLREARVDPLIIQSRRSNLLKWKYHRYPQEIIRTGRDSFDNFECEWHHRDTLFLFTPERYKELWPNTITDQSGKPWLNDDHGEAHQMRSYQSKNNLTVRWCATKEMVEQAIQDNLEEKLVQVREIIQIL